MKTALTIFLVLVTAVAIFFSLTREKRAKAGQEDLLAKTSDAAKARRTITIVGDDWLGYAVLRSPRFAKLLADKGIRVKFEMVPDTADRFQGMAEGRYQLAAATLDSYLSQGGASNWPAAIVWTIDESNGGDAIVAVPPIKTIDDLNNAKGAYTKSSPSEFLLKSEVSHFQLENLKGRIPSMGKNTVEEAYHDLRSGKVNFAVLWEPFKTKALQEIPGAHVVIDTSQVQGIIIDILLASRKEIAENPNDLTLVAQAYFQTLHEWLASPATIAEAALGDIRTRDTSKTLPDAAKMVEGIRFATLQDNTCRNGWTCTENPKLVTATEQLQRILENLGTRVNLPGGDSKAILYSKASHAFPEIPAPAGSHPSLGYYYKPLTSAQWEELRGKVKGTLLETPVLFRPGQSEIPQEVQDDLKEAVPKLAHYPAYRIIVEAHSYGNTPDVDMKLSEERAAEVKRFLTWECGIADERVLALGRGAEDLLPRQPDENEQAYARRSRRARVLLVGD